MNFYISDHHFGHANIIRHCERPFGTIEEMDEMMLTKWNTKVSDADDVWILGDLFFCSANVESMLERLKGRKHLIVGNHDSSWIGRVDLNRYFASVEEIHTGVVGGQQVTMCHYPMLSWPLDRHSFMIYGHIHNHTHADYWPLIAKRERMLNAGVEVNNYEPVTFEELIANNEKFRAEASR